MGPLRYGLRFPPPIADDLRFKHNLDELSNDERLPVSGSHLCLSANRVGRDFIVGDIHGQLGLLEALLEGVQFKVGVDRLIALGDLVDRGLESEEVMDLFTRTPGFHSLMGNHEFLMLQSAQNPKAAKLWNLNGNEWARRADPERLASMRAFAAQLPLSIQLELSDGRSIGLIHAEVPADSSWGDVLATALDHGRPVDDEDGLQLSLLWGRSRYTALSTVVRDPHAKSVPRRRREEIRKLLEPTPGIAEIFCGHSVPGLEPVRLGNHHLIDTAAFFPGKGRMTFVEPLHRHYWQAMNPLFPEIRESRPRPLPGAFQLPPGYLRPGPKPRPDEPKFQ